MRLVTLAYLGPYLLSLLGNSIAGIALPLIVLQTTGSALGAGTVAAATALPAILAGLVMGVVIDRINRRTSSILTDLISAFSVAALPLIDLISGLHLGWFILFGVIGAIGDVPGATAREALLPAIVRHGTIPAERLMGIREALGALALIIGPALAGTLMALFNGSTVLWITAATSLSAALLTLLIPHAVGAVTPVVTTTKRSGWAQLRDGWKVLFRTPFLLATTALSIISVLVLAPLQGLILPVVFSTAGQPGLLGFVLTALAAGMLTGSAIYAVAGTRGDRRRWFLTGLIGTGIGFGIIAILAPLWVIFLGAFTVGLSSGLFGSLIGVLMIERIPEDMRGRVMGTQNALMTAAPPLGIVLAMVITEYVGAQAAAIAVACVWLAAIVLGLSAQALRNLEPQSENGAVQHAQQ